jgi:hypothetical protein
VTRGSSPTSRQQRVCLRLAACAGLAVALIVPSNAAPQGARPRAPAARAVAPPAPGRLPFDPGELARYDLGWQAAAAGLSAGVAEVTVAADRSEPRAALRLDLSIETAAWVSWFFEAHDRFWTLATADLVPLLHRQEIHEGRKRLERTARYDARTHVVRSGEGRLEGVADGVTTPLDPAARDAMTAFFFVRTVALSPGARLRFPVDNLGRPHTVEVQAGATGTVTAEGKRQPAQRLDVAVHDAGAADTALRAVAWLSTDARRIPLLLEVQAGFGTFTGTLVTYRHPAAGAARGGR